MERSLVYLDLLLVQSTGNRTFSRGWGVMHFLPLLMSIDILGKQITELG